MLLALLALEPVTARAIEPEGNMFELGFSGGAFIPAQDHELYDSLQSFQAPLSLGMSLELRASYLPLSFVGAELEGGYMPLSLEGGGRAHLYSVRAHLLLQVPWRLSPFFVMGGGLLGLSSRSGGDSDRALHWGLGAKYYIKDWLSVRVDGRHIISAAEGPGQGNTNHFQVTAGVSITLWRGWGRKTPKPEPELEPELQPMLSEARPQAISRAITMEDPSARISELLDGVHFAFDSAELKPNAFPALDLTISLLKQNPLVKVYVLGHTDNVGTDSYNLSLSERRAITVADYLRTHGVPEEQVELRWFGESQPLRSNETELGRAQNRRTEFEVVSEGGLQAGAKTAPKPLP